MSKSPGRDSRRTFAFRLLLAGQVAIGIGQSVLFAVLPPAARDVGISPFRVSLIFVVSATIWVFVSPWWGRQSDVWGRRPVILTGLLGFSLSMALLATSVHVALAGLLPVALAWPLMIASRSVFALLGSGTGPAAQAYIADRTDVAERPAAVAFLTSGFAIGQTVGPALGAALATWGVLAPLYLSAAMATLSALAVGLWLPEERRGRAAQRDRRPRLKARDPRVLPFVLIAAALQAVRATTTMTLAFLLQDRLGLDTTEAVQYAGAGFTALAVAGLATQLWAVQRLRPTARRMILLGLPLLAIAFVLFCVAGSAALHVVALVVLGVGLALVRPGCAAGASISVTPEEQGAAAGLLNGIAVVGNIFGPMIGTRLYEIAPVLPYGFNLALVLAAMVYALRHPRVHRLPG